MRYCCSVLKESSSEHRLSITGVRRAESVKRRESGVLIVKHKDKDKRIHVDDEILLHDNDVTRTVTERCKIKSTININPIVDWSDEDVKDYIDSEHINICNLYKCGFNRVGCIGCPMTAGKKRNFEFGMFPKFKDMYIRAFDKMLKERKTSGLENKMHWQSAIDVYHWWMEDGVLPGQMSLLDI